METAVRGYGLDDYIYGTKITPPKFIRDKEDKLVQNPEFLTFQRQDSLICAWMMSSIGATILPQLIGVKTAHEVWSTIKVNFSTQSSARIMNHRRQLHSIKKGDLTMKEYLIKVKKYLLLAQMAVFKSNMFRGKRDDE